VARVRGAEHAFQRADYGEAERLYGEALSGLPGVEHAPTLAAFLGLSAAQDYRRWIASLHGNLGLSRMRQRRWEDAERSLSAALELDPRSNTTRTNLGLAQLHARRYPEAYATLASAAEAGAESAKDRLDLGRAAYHAGFQDRACTALRQALCATRADPGVEAWGVALDAQKLLARADLDRGAWSEAERRLEAVLEQAPGDAEARYFLVLALARQGRDQEAERERARQERDASLHAAIQTRLLEAGDSRELSTVAELYRELGLLHLAHVHYAQLAARDPRDPAARHSMRSIEALARERTAPMFEGG